MNTFPILSALLLLVAACQGPVTSPQPTVPPASAGTVQEGDIVFQVSMSPQCEAIRAATGSVYAHCGVVHFKEGVPYVLEAVQPVRSIPLTEWIGHGRNDHYVAKRLRDPSLLTDAVMEHMRTIGSRMIGADYDAWFMWSDQQIYCSELVWKIYQRGAGVELCALRPLGDFDLSAPVVRQVMQQRYGYKVPLKEPMVSPGDLFDSPLLVEVMREGRP